MVNNKKKRGFQAGRRMFVNGTGNTTCPADANTPEKTVPYESFLDRELRRADELQRPVSTEAVSSPIEREGVYEHVNGEIFARQVHIPASSGEKVVDNSSNSCPDIPPVQSSLGEHSEISGGGEEVKDPRSTPSCSIETRATPGSSNLSVDGLVAFLSMSNWEQIETLCELIACIGPYELRLLGSCIEGAARTQSVNLRPHEARANCPSFVAGLTTQLRLSFLEAVDCAFSLICLLHSTNRSGAYAFVRLIDQLMADRNEQISLLPEEYRSKAIESLGKLVAASLHHPAFSVDQRIRLVRARDELKSQLDDFASTPITTRTPTPELELEASVPHIYIRSFDATLLSSKNEEFMIEITWNDGDRTCVKRSRSELASLHYRLLDLFGAERRDGKEIDLEAASSDSISRQSTPTQSSSPAATTATGSCRRILPYFSKDAPANLIIDYINGLSDLPARMMLSPVIYEEFFASREKSTTMRHAACTKSSGSSSVSTRSLSSQNKTSSSAQSSAPVTAPQTFAVAAHPLSYGPLGSVPVLQLRNPTCSNCADNHSYVQCDKVNILDMAQSTKDGYHLKLSDSDRSEIRNRGAQQAPPLSVPGPMPLHENVVTRYPNQPHPQHMIQYAYVPSSHQ